MKKIEDEYRKSHLITARSLLLQVMKPGSIVIYQVGRNLPSGYFKIKCLFFWSNFYYVILENKLSKFQKKQIVLLHDHGHDHDGKLLPGFLRFAGMEHSPYNSGLAPCGFFLFPTMKKKSRKIFFSTSEEAVNYFKSMLVQWLKKSGLREM